MTIEKKFRAWNKQQKVMCYKNEDEDADYWDGAFASTVELINRNLSNDRYIFMPHIGLKDKSGKEIYVGDILKHEDRVQVVKPPEWFTCDAYTVYGYKGLDDFKDDVIEDKEVSRFILQCEVAGNIYEHPELIK